MKKIRIFVPVLLIALFAGSAYYLVDSRAAVIREYHAKLRQAREAVKNGVLADGHTLYEEALSIYPSIEIYTEAGNVYINADDLDGAKKWYERDFLMKYPNAPETYEYGIRVSLAMEDCREAFAIYDVCTKREAVSKAVEQLMEPVWYKYELLYGNYDEAGAFSSKNGFAAVKSNDRWGYVDQDGKSKLPALYQSADVFGDYAAVNDRDSGPCYIDASGEIKITASQLVDPDGDAAKITAFRPIADSMILACDNREWAYYDLENYQKLFGGYADATVIANGIGAVTKDGRTWALIGGDGKEITGYDYGQVVTNPRGILCCTKGLFVQKDGRYWLVDTTGNNISNNSYDAVDAFCENSLAAVQKNGKWIFINESGEEKDLGDFEEARSFSNGLAAVKINGMWGYIDQEGKQAVDCIFYDAGAFNSAGAAFVKTTDEYWNVLSLYRYHFD